jgi:undecaprenyl-diphosphatase
VRLEERRRLWLERERLCLVWLHGAAAQPVVVLLLMTVSRLSDGLLWYGLMLILPWWGGANGTACAIRMLGLGALNLLIYQVVKRHFARPRPYKTCPGIRACARSLDEYSFPSGHAMHAVAYSVLLGVYYPEFTPLLWGFTALVALSRVVLGLHYPSDVVIGAAIGLLTAESALSLL